MLNQETGKLPVYTVDVHVDPTPHLTKQTPVGVNPVQIMRDFHVVESYPDKLVLAVGDMANNGSTTPTFVYPSLAESAGLPHDYRFNGGLIGSIALRNLFTQTVASGNELLYAANETIRHTYLDLSIIDAPENAPHIDPIHRFTGYIGHALVGPEVTTLTSTEDIFIYLNGKLHQGADKVTEVRKQALIDELSGIVLSPTEDVIERAEETLTNYANAVNLPRDIFRETLADLQVALATIPAEQRSRQTIYTCISEHISAWQVRSLQNNTNHPDGFAAIDGTTTVGAGIYINEVPTAEIETLVLSTDGMEPTSDTVRSVRDLRPVNPEYSEQTVVTANFLHEAALEAVIPYFRRIFSSALPRANSSISLSR